MRKIHLLLIIVLIPSVQLFSQWVEQATGFATASRGIKYICTVDQNVVWATAYDGVNTSNYITEFTRTTDGGTTWTAGTVSGYTSGYGSSMIYAVDGNTAWMPVFNTTAGGGAILKTTDGGATWTEQASATFSAPAGFPNIVHFWDANSGFCQGDPNGGYFEIYTTTDGGTTWTRVPQVNIPDPVAADEYGVTGFYSVIGDTVWFSTNKGRVFKSIDRGNNWTVATTPLTDQFKIIFKDGNNGIAYQISNGSICETSDGGATWTTFTPSGNLYGTDIAYVPGTPNTYVSTDAANSAASYSFYGGHYWTDFTNVPGQMLATSWVDASTGWVGSFNTDATTGGMYKYSGTLPSPPNNDLGAVNLVSPTNGLALTTTESLSVEIMNYGLNPQTGFDVAYSINGGAPVSETVSATINPGEVYTYTFTATEDFSNVGTYDISIYTSLLNDEDNTNDTFDITLMLVSWIPQKIVFGEEATGTWCSWCVRGHVYMDYMANTYPNTWIGVAVHNNDPMVVPDYDNGIAPYITGYPSGLVDRAGGEMDPSVFEDGYNARIGEISPVDLTIQNASWDSVTRLITFDVQGEFVTNITADYRLNGIIVENGVTGTGAGWDQANAYSGGAYGPMGGYENLPNPVPAADMVYEHVGRALLGGWNGTAGSVPATIANNDIYSQSYSYTLPAEYDEMNIELVGILIDQTSGEVLNATKFDLSALIVGKENIVEENNIMIYPNPAENFVNIKAGEPGYIKITTITGKLVYSDNFNNSFTRIDISDFATGTYIIQITTNSETTTQKLVIE